MTGQMSIFDFPEYMPEDKEFELKQILFDNCSQRALSLIKAGCTEGMIKSYFGTSGGTAIGARLIMYDGSGCRFVSNDGETHKYTWKQYIEAIRQLCKKKGINLS